MPKLDTNSICYGCEGDLEAKTSCIKGRGETGGIMIIGDSPSYFEDDTDDLFIGEVGRTVGQALYDVGIDISRCYLTKAIKCYHGTDKIPKATIKNCRQILLDEIEQVKPKFILTFGSVALEVLTGKGNISKLRGTRYYINGAQVISTYNPTAVIKFPSLGLEFDSDLRYFSRLVMGVGIPKDFKWEIVDTSNKVALMLDAVKRTCEMAYDIETTGLKNPKTGKIHMIGVAIKGMCYVIPLETPHFPHFAFDKQELLNALLCKSNNIFHIAHFAKFDNRWLRIRGKVEPYVDYDTYLASYVLNVNIPHGLKHLAKMFLDAIDYDEGIEFKEELTYEEFMAMAEYCALDVYYTLKLFYLTKKELQTDGRQFRVFKYIVMPGERVLQKIEDKGVYVDSIGMAKVTEEYKKTLANIELEIEDLLPAKWKGNINLGSPKQLGELLFKDLKLPVISKTATGASSTGKATLLRLVEYHKLPQLILARRKYAKALDGFLVPWVDYLAEDSRLHTTYDIAKTSTGRLAASDPNLQQVPRDKNVRNLICAPPGRAFIEADYSQIELRIAAFVAGSETMKNAYRQGKDLHTITASMVSGVPMGAVTKDQRQGAKAVNFGEKQ